MGYRESFDDWLLLHRLEAPSPLAPFFVSGLQEYKDEIAKMEAEGLIVRHAPSCSEAECAWLSPNGYEKIHYAFTEKGRELYAPRVMAAVLKERA